VFTNAIVRAPSRTFAGGLTTAGLGRPDLDTTFAQHADYCAALEQCGLRLTRLESDDRFPDATFVEDTAILTDRVAILTNPGAPSRQGEVAAVREALKAFYASPDAILAPGTLDGGDICQAGERFFIGISHRTNGAGARQLAEILSRHGYSATMVDIRDIPSLLHLKSGLAALDGGRLVLIEALADHPAFRGYESIPVAVEELYAANCVQVNDRVLVAAGFPRTQEALRDRGYSLIVLDVSEFQKMDGGLSCLSLRF
jgi:dimethylargininase